MLNKKPGLQREAWGGIQDPRQEVCRDLRLLWEKEEMTFDSEGGSGRGKVMGIKWRQL